MAYKAPEEFLRELRERTAKSAVASTLGTIAILVFLVRALGDAMYRQDRPGEMQLAGWVEVLRTGGATLWLQVVCLVLCLGGIRRGLGAYTAHVDQAFLDDYLVAGGGSPAGINSWVPAIGEFLDGGSGLLGVPLLLAVLLVWRRTAGRTWPVVLGVLLILLFQSVVSPARDFYHAGILLAKSIPRLLILGFLVWKYIRFNLLCYAVMAWSSMIFSGIRYLEFDAGIFKINGLLMVLFGCAPLLLAALAWHRERAGAGRSLPSAGRGDP